MELKSVLTCLCVLTMHLQLSEHAALSIYEQKKYKSLIEGQGLYTADDDVEILTNENFKNMIYGQKNAWLVEFYNSWCGFCQRFAPSWKALATDIKDWKGVVNVGAIDCSDNDNSGLCREFEIMAYPTLRYFHEGYMEDPKNLGVDVKKGTDMAEHKSYLLRHMIAEQSAKRGKQFPNLLPYQHANVLHLFEGNVNAKYVFLIIDEPESTIGIQLALDFYKHKEISIKYAMTSNDKLVDNLKAKVFPYMTVLTDSSSAAHEFRGDLQTREALRSAIVKYVKPNLFISTQSAANIFTGKWVNAEVPDIGSLLEAKGKKQLRDKVKRMGDVVFQADLESALRYALKHEIGATKNIFGEKLVALQTFLQVLVKYFPFGVEGKTFLMEVRDYAAGKTVLDGADIAEIVNRNDKDGKNVFSSRHQWIACEGSSQEHRGYPCGLWKLFHFLTVESSERNGGPKEVLRSMHSYIKNFFGCADCSKHFQAMATNKDLEGVTSANSAVLWLWMAHNEVNKRLAGDQTEDPEYPKIQFPAPDNCPKCKINNNWDYNEVLKYLKHMYSNINIRYIGADSSILHPGVKQRNGTSSIYEQIDATRISEKDVRT